MSVVHNKLRQPGKPAAEPVRRAEDLAALPPPVAAAPAAPAPHRPEKPQPGDSLRAKEQRLREGLARMTQELRDLRRRLAESEAQRAEQTKELEQLRSEARAREAEWARRSEELEAHVAALEAQPVTARDRPGGRARGAEAAEGSPSLLAQARRR